MIGYVICSTTCSKGIVYYAGFYERNGILQPTTSKFQPKVLENMSDAILELVRIGRTLQEMEGVCGMSQEVNDFYESIMRNPTIRPLSLGPSIA